MHLIYFSLMGPRPNMQVPDRGQISFYTLASVLSARQSGKMAIGDVCLEVVGTGTLTLKVQRHFCMFRTQCHTHTHMSMHIHTHTHTHARMFTRTLQVQKQFHVDAASSGVDRLCANGTGSHAPRKHQLSQRPYYHDGTTQVPTSVSHSASHSYVPVYQCCVAHAVTLHQ